MAAPTYLPRCTRATKQELDRRQKPEFGTLMIRQQADTGGSAPVRAMKVCGTWVRQCLLEPNTWWSAGQSRPSPGGAQLAAEPLSRRPPPAQARRGATGAVA